jgi:hypothetical protein
VVDLERRWSVLTVLFPIAEHNERRRGETGFHARLGSERHPVLVVSNDRLHRPPIAWRRKRAAKPPLEVGNV